MPHHQHRACIDACYACADACDHCAIACLGEPQPKLMARCVALDIDCAQVCRLAAGFMARGSQHDSAVCALCAMVCESCAEECNRHAMDHCQQCAAACRKCAGECRRMAERPARANTPAGTHVGA
jgi:hypothetical protein